MHPLRYTIYSDSLMIPVIEASNNNYNNNKNVVFNTKSKLIFFELMLWQIVFVEVSVVLQRFLPEYM